MRNKNFLVNILLIINILVWGYYFIYCSNIISSWFIDIDKISPIDNNQDTGNLEILFYDNSEKNLVILRTPTNKIVIINTGIDKKAINLKDYIKANKLFFIDKIFLTNNNEESINGLRVLLNDISIGEIIDGSTSIERNREYDFFRYFLRYHPEIGYVRPIQGESIYVDPYLNIRTYFAIDENLEKFADMFLLINYNNINILFTTDNYAEGQFDFLDEFYIRHVDVLQYPNIKYHQNISKKTIQNLEIKYLVVGDNSIYRGDFIDMNVWNVFNENKFYVKYIGNEKEKPLILQSDGKSIRFRR
ncbi:MAG: hypothetical protein GY817_03900 [bacterium]|nr:hypothetical protein [bacterium]